MHRVSSYLCCFLMTTFCFPTNFKVRRSEQETSVVTVLGSVGHQSILMVTLSWALIMNVGVDLGLFMWVVVRNLQITIGEITQWCTFCGSVPSQEWFDELQTLNETCQATVWIVLGFETLNVKLQSCFLRVSCQCGAEVQFPLWSRLVSSH